MSEQQRRHSKTNGSSRGTRGGNATRGSSAARGGNAARGGANASRGTNTRNASTRGSGAAHSGAKGAARSGKHTGAASSSHGKSSRSRRGNITLPSTRSAKRSMPQNKYTQQSSSHTSSKQASYAAPKHTSFAPAQKSAITLPRLNDMLPLAMLVAAVLLIFFILRGIVGCTAGVLTHHNSYYGTGGIQKTELYEKKAKTFYTDLLIPHIFAPARPTKATVTGTRRDTGSAGDQLTAAIKAVESEGYQVGFSLYDINTGITVTYNANSAFYSASSLKGPYVISLTKYELGSNVKSEATRLENIIKWSDNDSYSNLRDAYGNNCFAQLAEASGATGMSFTAATDGLADYEYYTSSITDNKYEYISPNQMVALWKECYNFLNSDEPGASYLAELFQEPEVSAIRASASAYGTTWSKAGWYPSSDGYSTTVDAGAVCTNTGDFILCVMTTKGEDFVALESIVSPLIAVRETLVN